NEGARMRVRERDPARWGHRFRVTYWSDLRTQVGEEEWQTLDYNPHTRPWYRGAVGLLEELSSSPEYAQGDDSDAHGHRLPKFWTKPYTFFTSQEPGITAAGAWKDEQGKVTVFGMDVLLLDISRFTTDLQVGENGFAFVLDEDDRLVGLPRHAQYEEPAALRSSVLTPSSLSGTPALEQVVFDWQARGRPRADVFSLDAPGGRWWAAMRTHALGASQSIYIGVAIPESDFLAPMRRQRNHIAAISVAALLVALVMALWMSRAIKRSLKLAADEARHLGQYEIDGKIGEGAMGSVYKAHHSMLRRPTAIKVVREDKFGRSNILARFEREAQLTSKLTHPNTIAVYDFGHTPNGVFYYAMELLEGFTLSTVLKRTGPMPPGRVIFLLKQLCESLAEAHDVGLIHRDIKPGNIMLTNRGANPDFVKLLDFGLVKRFDDDDAQLTQHDAVAGTPAYLAPEAITAPTIVGPKADIYALGCVAYTLLTNRPVFEGSTNIQVCSKHVSALPTSPAKYMSESLSPDLESVILDCLQKSPAQRPENTIELAKRLMRCAQASEWGPASARAWWSSSGVALQDYADAEARKREPESLDDRLTIDLQSRS
ncbi:MAG: serine/threonine protein kinase, partial [Gammaproteobacteria bacterium]